MVDKAPPPARSLVEARSLLLDLASAVDPFAGPLARDLDDPEVKRRAVATRRAIDEATARLSAPALSIATLGTTSSGKSTLVNALIGRRIAPIEAGEMSGGVLRLGHEQRASMTIDATRDAAWAPGTFSDVRDRDIYDHLRDKVMRPYLEARRTRALSAPSIRVGGPLLPVVDRSLLGLPEGVSVELVDLPGLKAMNDRINLSVIQGHVHKAFTLVVLDYLQTDDGNRKRLLDELRRVVQHLGGRPDAALFVLNRTDARSSRDDIPLDERVALLRLEVSEVLGLEDLPEILPMSARLLYYASCSWGPSPLSAQPTTSPDERVDMLTALFHDCGGHLRASSRHNRAQRDFLVDLEDQLIETRRPPSLDDHRRLVQMAREISGGELLFRKLRERVQQSFTEAVIVPAVVDVLDAEASLAQSLDTVITVKKLSTTRQIDDERRRLAESWKGLQAQVSATRDRFRIRLTGAARLLSEAPGESRPPPELQRGFDTLDAAVARISHDLQSMLIAPVAAALSRGQADLQLTEELALALSPPVAEAVLSTCGFVCDLAAKGAPPDALARAGASLDLAMSDALAERAQVALQQQAVRLRDALTAMLDQQAEALCERCERLLPGLRAEQTIAATARAYIKPERLSLPEWLFTSIPTSTSRPPSVSPTDLPRRWAIAVSDAQAEIDRQLRTWMASALYDCSAVFAVSIDTIVSLGQRALDERQAALTRGNAHEATLLGEIEAGAARLQATIERLERLARGASKSG